MNLLDESNSKIVTTNGNTRLTQFSCPTSSRKKVSKVKLEGATLQCKKVKQ